MKFLQKFFNLLNKEEIQYSVLRNYDKLPESTDGSDLDIFIAEKHINNFKDTLDILHHKYNLSVISLIPSANCPRVCIAGKEWGLLIDLHIGDIKYRGYKIVTEQDILNHTELFKNEIFVLDKKVDALLGLVKEVLNSHSVKKKYYDSFKEYSFDRSFLYSIFTPINRSFLVEELLAYKGIVYNVEAVERLVNLFDEAFPYKFVHSINKIYKTRRLFQQPGYSMAVLGTDGSGKSTIIKEITPTLNDAFHNAVYYEHLRPNRLPSLASLFGKKQDRTGPVTNPHGSTSSGFVGSLFRWAYYLLDYTIGFFLKIWPKKAIRSCVWIFDRYYYDYLIDPKRSRVNLPKWLLKLGQFIIPEPDIILCLGTDPQIIHERKPELTLAEVERQVRALQAFCAEHPRAKWIDTGKHIDESSNEALEYIIQVMARRFKDVKIVK